MPLPGGDTESELAHVTGTIHGLGERRDPAGPIDRDNESFCRQGLVSDFDRLLLNPMIQNKGTRDDREALFCSCPDLSYIPRPRKRSPGGWSWQVRQGLKRPHERIPEKT